MNKEQHTFPYIQRLLNGAEVEWKPLEEVAELKRGTTITQKTSTIGVYPVISGGKQPAYYIDKFNRDGDTITIAGSGAYAGFVMYWNEPIFVSDAFSIKANNTQVLPRYIYHFLLNIQEKIYALKAGGGVPHVYAKDVARFLIPIPCPTDSKKSLEIQHKIVDILDKFTKLEMELEAELDCRKRQYEYYRNQLLSFEMLNGGGKTLNNVIWMSIENISKSISSGGTPRSNISAYYGGHIPWLRTQEVNFSEIWDTEVKITKEGMESSSAKYIPSNCVIVAMYGATVGRVGINKISLTTNQACANIEINKDIALYKYVFHYLSSQYENIKLLGAGTQTNINAKIVKNIKIPIPSLSEQQRIVSILDKFDTLINSISEGLPKEIELRRKQYEYYRNALLSFNHISEHKSASAV